MAVGLPMKTTYANGDVYSASDVNDITGTVNLIGQTNNLYAGKNKIINGDFGVWQRGTSFSAYNVYLSDRWYGTGDRTSPSFSQQTFTPGTAPVAGYEGKYYARWVPGSSGTYSNIQQRIEDVRTFAGQTVTLSYWAKISTGTATNSPYIVQSFGSGGSGDVSTALSTATITTTWTRFSHTVAVPSISGKTVGTSSYLSILPLRFETASTANVDFWGVQVEAGSTATAFQTATGTIQGELAACQRYYWRVTPGASGKAFCMAQSFLSTNAIGLMPFPVTMRIAPTSMEQSGTASHYAITDSGYTARACTAVPATVAEMTDSVAGIYITATNMVAGYATSLRTNNAAAYLGWSAEL